MIWRTWLGLVQVFNNARRERTIATKVACVNNMSPFCLVYRHRIGWELLSCLLLQFLVIGLLFQQVVKKTMLAQETNLLGA